MIEKGLGESRGDQCQDAAVWSPTSPGTIAIGYHNEAGKMIKTFSPVDVMYGFKMRSKYIRTKIYYVVRIG